MKLCPALPVMAGKGQVAGKNNFFGKSSKRLLAVWQGLSAILFSENWGARFMNRVDKIAHLHFTAEAAMKLETRNGGNVVRQMAVAALAALLIVLACSMPASAQTNQGSIAGNVLDPSGAVVQNVKVVAKSVTTGATYETLSSSAGTSMCGDVDQLPAANSTHEIPTSVARSSVSSKVRSSTLSVSSPMSMVTSVRPRRQGAGHLDRFAGDV